MDQRTRNEFEQFCALAEIEEDPKKFAQIKGNIVRLLDEKEAWLNRKRVNTRLRHSTAPPNVA